MGGAPLNKLMLKISLIIINFRLYWGKIQDEGDRHLSFFLDFIGKG
jgi:hypothetical protein